MEIYTEATSIAIHACFSRNIMAWLFEINIVGCGDVDMRLGSYIKVLITKDFVTLSPPSPWHMVCSL